MAEDIDLSEIDKKYKDKCSLIKAGICKNVNIFLQQSRENARLKEEIKEVKKYQYEQEFLEKENIKLREQYEIARNVLLIIAENLSEIKETAKDILEMNCKFDDMITKDAQKIIEIVKKIGIE